MRFLASSPREKSPDETHRGKENEIDEEDEEEKDVERENRGAERVDAVLAAREGS